MIRLAYPIGLGAALAATVVAFAFWVPDDPECVAELERRGLIPALRWQSSCNIPAYIKKRSVEWPSEAPTALEKLEGSLLWWRACPAVGPGVLEDAAHLPPMARAQHIYTACGLAERGWIDIETFSAYPERAELGLLAAAWMTDIGLEPSKAGDLTLRNIMLSHNRNVPRDGAVVHLPRVPSYPGVAISTSKSVYYHMSISKKDVRVGNGWGGSSWGRIHKGSYPTAHVADGRLKDRATQPAVEDIHDALGEEIDLNRQLPGCFRTFDYGRLWIDRDVPFKLISEILYHPHSYGLFDLVVGATRHINGQHVDDTLKLIPIGLLRPKTEPAPDTLYVAITAHGYTLSSRGVELGADLTRRSPEGAYPTRRIRERLALLKRTYEAKRGKLNIVVAPAPDVHYAVIATTLAAVVGYDEDGRVGLSKASSRH